MEQVKFKVGGLQASQLGLGCMRIANKSYEEVEALIFKALDLGINFFDHADIYGKGKSEELFGEVIKRHPEIRSQMIIQSKCAIVPGVMYDFSKEHIIESVKGSIARLNCGYLDILLLHRPDALCDPLEVKEAFEYLHGQGLVKYFGVSNHTPYQMQLLEKYLPFPLIANQLQLSIVHAGMIDAGINMNMTDNLAIDRDGGILDYCRIHDIVIQPWSALQASWEEGTFIDNPNYGPLNEVLATLATKYQVSKAVIAIAWLLRHPANLQPILGTTSAKHLEEIVVATKIQLTRSEWYQLYLAAGHKLP